MRTIKNMPEQLFNTVVEVVDGLNKVFHSVQGNYKVLDKLVR
jgi:hypothetical protein